MPVRSGQDADFAGCPRSRVFRDLSDYEATVQATSRVSNCARPGAPDGEAGGGRSGGRGGFGGGGRGGDRGERGGRRWLFNGTNQEGEPALLYYLPVKCGCSGSATRATVDLPYGGLSLILIWVETAVGNMQPAGLAPRKSSSLAAG